jgi:hypothetical protein
VSGTISQPNGSSSVSYTVGSTAQTDFVVPFQFDEAADLSVSVNGTAVGVFTFASSTVLDGIYTAATIRLPSSVANSTVTIVRNTQLQQGTIFPVAGLFSVRALNREVTRLWQAMQDNFRRSAGGSGNSSGVQISSFMTPVVSAIDAPTARGLLATMASDAISAFMLTVVSAANAVAARAGLGIVDPSSFMATVLPAANAATARATLGVVDPPAGIDLNLLTNGGFEVWQGSPSLSIPANSTGNAAIYGPDRWCMETGASQQALLSRQTSFGALSRFLCRVQRVAGQNGVGTLRFQQPIELADIIRMRGQTVALQVKMRGGADFSGSMQVQLICGTETEGRRTNAAAYTGETTPLSQALALTTSAQTFNVTAAAVVPANCTQMTLAFAWTPVGTAGTNDWFDVAEVALAVTPGIPAFAPRLYQEELARCQRFFAVQGHDVVQRFYTVGNSSGFLPLRFPVPMRAAPTVTPVWIDANGNAASYLVRGITAAGAVFELISTTTGDTFVNLTSATTYDARL